VVPAALGALVVVGLVVLGWVWRHPDALPGPGDVMSVNSRVGVQAAVGVLSPSLHDDRILSVRSVTPRVLSAPPGTTVRVVACRDGAVGAVRGSLSRYCTRVRSAEGAHLRPGAEGDWLVAVIRSSKPGRVVVDGVEVGYSYGWQRGSQVTGPRIVVSFRG
jgi:hypothetical protein